MKANNNEPISFDNKEEPELDSFGKRLIFLRKSKKLSQDDLSIEVNIDRSLISRYERDLDTPHNHNLRKLSNYFSEEEFIFLKSNISSYFFKKRLKKELFDKEQFALRLKKIRSIKKISQVDLSKISGIYHGTIAKYERCYSTPDLASIIKLSDSLGVTIDFLLRGENTNTNNRDLIDSSLIQTFYHASKCNSNEKEALILIIDAAIKGFRK